MNELFVSGNGRGDPHIITMDGRAYSFNGIGEYYHVKSPHFTMQTRLKLAKSFDGRAPKATVYGGLAMKATGSDIVQVKFLFSIRIS